MQKKNKKTITTLATPKFWIFRVQKPPQKNRHNPNKIKKSKQQNHFDIRRRKTKQKQKRSAVINNYDRIVNSYTAQRLNSLKWKHSGS